MKTLIIIPSRLSATRLPGKPLLKIKGLSIISHVFRRAQEANIGEVVVATEDLEIAARELSKLHLLPSIYCTATTDVYSMFQKFL